eukprot:IDg7434t1
MVKQLSKVVRKATTYHMHEESSGDHLLAIAVDRPT